MALSSSGPTIMGGPGFLKEVEKKTISPSSQFATYDFSRNVTPESRFIFGKRLLPSLGDVAKGAVGLKSGSTIKSDIDDDNRDVIERAKTLTYLQSIGAKIPPRVQIAGAGGKAAKAVGAAIIRNFPSALPAINLPEVLFFVPSQRARTPLSTLGRDVVGWTPAQRFQFVQPNSQGVSPYALYLNAGSPVIPILQETLQHGSTNQRAARDVIAGIQDDEEEEAPAESKDPESKEPVPEEKVPTQGRGVFEIPEIKTLERFPAGMDAGQYNSLFIAVNRKQDLGITDSISKNRRAAIKIGAFLDFMRDWVAGGGSIKDKDAIRAAWIPIFNNKFSKDGQPKDPEPEAKGDEPPKQPEAKGDESPKQPEAKGVDPDDPDVPDDEGKHDDPPDPSSGDFDILKPGDPLKDPEGKVKKKTPGTISETAIIPSAPGGDPSKPSKTLEDVEKEKKEVKEEKEEKRRPGPPRPLNPKDPPPDPPPTDPKQIEEKNTDVRDRQRNLRLGRWRPLAPTGGQSILLLTEKEKLEEIKDWDLFDLPVDPHVDITNPIYRDNVRQENFRHFGLNGDYRPAHFYRDVPRQFKLNGSILAAQAPVMRPQHTQTDFRDPFDRTPFDTPTVRDRTAQSVTTDMIFRSSLLFPDLRVQIPDDSFGIPKPMVAFDSVSLSLAMK